MKTSIPQSSLNYWMHQIMTMLRERLEPLMTEAIRQSKTTYNDETRILVRSRIDKNAPFKYNVEYIHAALSLEKKLVSMVYDEGTRSHEVQEKAFFSDSKIKLFMADRAPIYSTIVKDLEEYEIERAACWVHSRRLFINAFLSDERVRPFLKMINAIFWIDKESKRLGHSFEQRQRYRQRHSKKLVDCIFELAKEYRQAGDEYGELVHKALDYILNDEEAFRRFLDHGELEASNNGIENLFRHIAMGRRNWLHTGSHYAAQNIAFMYSLYESCKLNNINFGNYIEDILTRFMYGEEADASFLPNQWVACTPDAGTQTA
ncbi:MAG: transposase [bacterium]|nr:transposase [Candidatus Limimorpha caballi]